jgi:peptidoglycan-N-acetylglucosamine deacetylase
MTDLSAPDGSAFDRVWLTFDDGPDEEWPPLVLDLLAANGLTATFFVIGCNALAMPKLLRRAVEEGHEIGNHSFTHRHPWTLAEREARDEIRSGAAVISDITGRPAQWFRPPHGRLRPCLREEAEQLGQSIALWTLSAIDWGPLGGASRIASRLAKLRDGDVVLMHDGRGRHNRPQELMAVLPAFLQRMRLADASL